MGVSERLPSVCESERLLVMDRETEWVLVFVFASLFSLKECVYCIHVVFTDCTPSHFKGVGLVHTV